MMQQLLNDLKSAMKQGEALKVSVLRMLLSELNYKKIELQRELTDEDVLIIVQKEVKKRREAIDSFTQGGRTDQAASENMEMAILQSYLPRQMDEAEVIKSLGEIKELVGVVDFGQAMKLVSGRFRGKAEGAIVAQAVQKFIART